jgi:hypothetical protein
MNISDDVDQDKDKGMGGASRGKSNHRSKRHKPHSRVFQVRPRINVGAAQN